MVVHQGVTEDSDFEFQRSDGQCVYAIGKITRRPENQLPELVVGSEHEDSFPPGARILEITNKHGSSSVLGGVCGFFRMEELTDK
jgi:hypothetical protein